MEEYNPDSNQAMPTGEIKEPQYRTVAIDDRTPYSNDNPRYKEKYEQHRKDGVPLYLCPQCGFLGRHKVTPIDYPTYSYPLGGEVCDICGDEDTYELGG